LVTKEDRDSNGGDEEEENEDEEHGNEDGPSLGLVRERGEGKIE